ncbi:hypothetical protein C9J21_08870 [Photobacterium phosphoreum]|nr:hypothetical protein C9J21_08870 [Photobacterium phosphoreum]
MRTKNSYGLRFTLDFSKRDFNKIRAIIITTSKPSIVIKLTRSCMKSNINGENHLENISILNKKINVLLEFFIGSYDNLTPQRRLQLIAVIIIDMSVILIMIYIVITRNILPRDFIQPRKEDRVK